MRETAKHVFRGIVILNIDDDLIDLITLLKKTKSASGQPPEALFVFRIRSKRKSAPEQPPGALFLFVVWMF